MSSVPPRAPPVMSHGGESSSTTTLPPASLSSIEQKEIAENEIDYTKEDLEMGEFKEDVTVAVPSAYPDGGIRAYLAALGGTMSLMVAFGISNSYGAFQSEYKQNQLADYSLSTISWIGSTHLAIGFTCGIPSGRLFDDGYFQYQLIAGSVVWTFGIMMLSLSRTFYQIFLSHGVVMGLGLGMLFSPALSCVGSYFQKRRVLMLGCTAGGAAIGATIFPIMLNHLFASIGFGPAVRAVAYLQIGVLVITNIIFRPRNLPPKPKVPVVTQMASFLRQPTTWLICGGAGFVMLGMWIPIFYIQLFAQKLKVAPFLIQYTVPLLNGSAIISRLTTGLIGDRYGVLTCEIPVAFITGCLIFSMLGIKNAAGIIAFDVFYGIFTGAWITLMAPGFMSLAFDVNEIGVRTGLGYLFVAVATLCGSPIAGALLSAGHGSYIGPCVFGGAVVIVGSVLIAAGRRLQVRRKGTVKVSNDTV